MVLLPTVHLVPTMTTVTARGVVWLVLKEVMFKSFLQVSQDPKVNLFGLQQDT